MATKTKQKTEPITAEWLRSFGLRAFKDYDGAYPEDECSLILRDKPEHLGDDWWMISFDNRKYGKGRHNPREWSVHITCFIEEKGHGQRSGMYWLPKVKAREEVLNLFAMLGVKAAHPLPTGEEPTTRDGEE